MNHFELIKETANGRVGALQTAHGSVNTPFFMPIATKGAVKGLTCGDLVSCDVKIILSNTFHLFLKPGCPILRRMGGLHPFMGWDRPILTDSGGFQVFSLSSLRTISDRGVSFRSPFDGTEFFLTPEQSIQIQSVIGSDIYMVLDECLRPAVSKSKAAQSIRLTRDWALRSKKQFERLRKRKNWNEQNRPLLFGIVQGSFFPDLRIMSCEEIASMGFDGIAIGGLAVGEGEEIMFDIASTVTDHLPKQTLRYFMGGAKPDQLVELIRRGIDCFDCVIPTRNARHGTLFLWARKDKNIFKKNFFTEIRIQNQKFSRDDRPIDPFCDCKACEKNSRAYLRHLFQMDDPLGPRLASIHNIRFYMKVFERFRELCDRM